MIGALDRYRRAWRAVEDVAAGVRYDWDRASPCPGWTARHLVGHLVDGHEQIRTMLLNSGTPHPITESTALADLAGTDPAATVRHTAATVAADLTGLDPAAMISTPHGELEVEHVLTVALIEPVVHGWDLAQATSQELRLDPDAVRILLAGVEQFGDQLAATGMYAPALPAPPDGSDVHRLLAAVGRRPGSKARS